MFPRDGNHSPAAFLAGFDVNEDVVFASFTPEGRLKIDASVSIDTVDIGDVNILLKVGGVNRQWNGVLNPDATTYAAWVQDQRMSYTGASLNVAVSNFPADYPDAGTHSRLDTLNATDFATETSLDAFRTDFAARDLSTETTLLALKNRADLLGTEVTLAGVLTTAAFQARINTLGQKLMAASTPVVLASDHSAISVSQSGVWTTARSWTLSSGTDSVAAVQSGTWNLNNISGTISLPTGAATAANQATANASLSSIDAKLTAPLSADVTDRVARELGRVLASHALYATAAYVTTDVLATARDFDVSHLKTKELVVANTGANSARVTVLGSVDSGANYDIVLASNVLLAAANIMEVSEARAFTHIRIQARASNAGNQTTITTRGYALGT